MSYVLHDLRGYVCDLGSAKGCLSLMKWLDGITHGIEVEGFLGKGSTEHPRKLAAEIDALLKKCPPKNADVVDIAKAFVAGLRRAHGKAVLTQ